MAKMIRHDYSAIHEALNKMILAEVKAALSLLPEKTIEGGSLCHIVVSPECDYEPRDLCVDKVWINDEGFLCFTGTENHGSFVVDDDPDPWTENDDLLDITDFGYLISQIAEKVEGEHDIRMKERGNLFYSERKIGDKVRWIGPYDVEVETYITGILAEQEDDEPEEIIYTSNLLRGNKLHTVYLTEDEISKD